jgi:cytochrome d ubiquinol oxidase subunit II
MREAAFILLAAILAGYIMLDGWDLGAGAVHLLYARTLDEREASFKAIGPFWNGNEVLLIAAGATLFALFPRAYAASFSGFYLPFIISLWLLMARGMSIELRGHFESELWRGFWDVTFAVSSALLAFIFGLALGNIVRGVPLDSAGYFAGTFAFLLNGYAVAVGFLALAALAMHGALFLSLRVNGDLRERVRRIGYAMWLSTLALFALVTALTLRVHPVPHSAGVWIAPAIAFAALLYLRFARRPLLAFASSGIFLAAMLASAAETLYPYLLPAFPVGSGGLDVINSAPSPYGVGTAFTAALIGVAAAAIYGTLAAWRMLRSGPSS